jgi:excisionase family DNA binding protein
MIKEYLTTFEAAKILSVSPDAVLKWIKSGILNARRTPGGHHRIAKSSIEKLLSLNEKIYSSKQDKQEFQYCWEFNCRSDNCPEDCESCVVYNIRAERCYKMLSFPEEFGHLKLYCKTSCEECNYFKFVQTTN